MKQHVYECRLSFPRLWQQVLLYAFRSSESVKLSSRGRFTFCRICWNGDTWIFSTTSHHHFRLQFQFQVYDICSKHGYANTSTMCAITRKFPPKMGRLFFNQQFLFLHLLTIAGQGIEITQLKKSCDCCIRHRKKTVGGKHWNDKLLWRRIPYTVHHFIFEKSIQVFQPKQR